MPAKPTFPMRVKGSDKTVSICDTLERARHWIDTLAPLYVARGYFLNKTLTPDSFTIIEA